MWFQLVTQSVLPYVYGGFSGLLGFRQCIPVCIPCLARCSTSTFLPPFAPRPLRRFNTTMEALTPVRCHFSERLTKWTFRLNPSHRSPCLTYSTFQTIPSPTTWSSPVVAFPSATLFVSATGFLSLFRLPILSPQVSRDRSRLRHSPASSPESPAETGSLTYGLVVRPLLLSTPPRGDAVTGGYRL